MAGPPADATGPIESPCVRLCTLDANDVCVGCGRTLDEIIRWTSMSSIERKAILKRLARRDGTGTADGTPG